MKLTLHEMAHSPYCIPVKRILEAWSVPFEVVDVPAWDRRKLAALTSGEYYQVPVLQHGDSIIHETPCDPNAVAHFLDREFCGGSLFPESWAGLHEILIGDIENNLEGKGFKLGDPYFLDSIEDIGERTMVIRHKERSFGRGCTEEWRANGAELLQEFEAELTPYEERLRHSPFLFGREPVYADFALFGVLGNFQFGGHFALDQKFTNLIRWQESLVGYSAQ